MNESATQTSKAPTLFSTGLDGRPPREFADYARETTATGVWEAA